LNIFFTKRYLFVNKITKPVHKSFPLHWNQSVLFFYW